MSGTKMKRLEEKTSIDIECHRAGKNNSEHHKSKKVSPGVIEKSQIKDSEPFRLLV